MYKIVCFFKKYQISWDILQFTESILGMLVLIWIHFLLSYQISLWNSTILQFFQNKLPKSVTRHLLTPATWRVLKNEWYLLIIWHFLRKLSSHGRLNIDYGCVGVFSAGVYIVNGNLIWRCDFQSTHFNNDFPIGDFCLFFNDTPRSENCVVYQKSILQGQTVGRKPIKLNHFWNHANRFYMSTLI